MARLLRDKPEAVEADLARFYGIDIRDRWVRGPHRLTGRRMFALLQCLPSDAAIWAVPSATGGLRPRPSPVEFRLLELLSTLTGEQHPTLARLDDDEARARGAETKSVLGRELAERAERYARR